MKKILFIVIVSATLMASCVSMREYEALQSQYAYATKGWNLTKQELQELREENAEFVRQDQAMTAMMSDMTTARQECEATVTQLNRAYAALQLHYDTTVENYLQQLTGKNRDLSKVNNLLEQRTRELNEKERAIREKERVMLEQQQELEQQLARLEENEVDINAALGAKQRELEQLRASVQKALVGFADKGLDIQVRDGKVYVSMADKLLFASGSWEVSTEGTEALKNIAKVLEGNPGLTVMVEGHTDNDVFHGSTAVKDNWDLSVMRATAVVKTLLRLGPKISPARVEAAGHAEYAPKVKNSSAANKAVNRRTEIILTPKLKEIIRLLE